MYVQMYQMLEEEQERRRKYKENRRKFRVAEFVSQFNTSNPQMPTVTFTAGDDLKLPKLDTNQA
jgi:7-keto-8-aminopelargonate synthetase-like enzyme